MKKINFKNRPGEMLNLWERLELKLSHDDANAHYISRIVDFAKEALTVEKPVRIGGSLELIEGSQVTVSFSRDDALYAFDAIITSIDPDRENIMILQIISDLKRIQRRRFVRIDIAGEVTFKIIEICDNHQAELSLDKKGSLLNISAGGILISTEIRLKKDCLVLLNFRLKNSQHLDNILGLVKRCEESKDAQDARIEYLAGIEFLSKGQSLKQFSGNFADNLPTKANFFDEALQQTIVQFVYRQQIESRKKTKVNA